MDDAAAGGYITMEPLRTDAPRNYAGSASSSARQGAPLVRPPGWRPQAHVLLFRPSSSSKAQALHSIITGVILVSTLCFVLQSLTAVAPWKGWLVIDGGVAVVF